MGKNKTKSIKAIQIYQRTGYNMTFTAPTLMCGRHEILHMAATYMVSQKVKFHLFYSDGVNSNKYARKQ